MDLWTRSIEVIRQNQWPSGAYLASPSFPVYRYSWLRDGSFIAYAMDVAGQEDSSRRFHQWVAGVLARYRRDVDRLLAAGARASADSAEKFLPARFNMDGSEDGTDWPNYQLDGYGTWLWALGEHLARADGRGGGHDVAAWVGAARVAADYVSAMWRQPNYDCWEENGNGIHPSTLACLAGGLRAAGKVFGRSDWGEKAEEIAAYIRANGIADGRLCKSVGWNEVDASLLWAGVPFGVFDAKDPVMVETVRLIEERLAGPGGAGVRRYPQDTYYGGGEWILLTAWLGWYHQRSGERGKAEALLAWIEKQADPRGFLPEQVPVNLNMPEYRETWIRRWGPAAVPLLWSHAMYLILREELERGESAARRAQGA